MKKLTDIYFYFFFLFLILCPIWPSMRTLYVVFLVGFLLFDFLFFWKCDKRKIKIDLWDVVLVLLPFFSFFPYLFHRNVYPFQDGVFSLCFELVLTISILVLRRCFTKEKIDTLLMVFLSVSTLYFFVSFIYQVWPKQMMLLGIFSYFGDTYLNSIDRFYGTFDYCNASALFFAISIFISFFKMKEDNHFLFFFLLFVNVLGFLFTFSKMVSIAFVLVLLTLFVFLLLRKKENMIQILVTHLGALIGPSLLMVSVYRSFLASLQFFSFLFGLFVCFGIYFLLQHFLAFLYKKKKIIVYLLLGSVVVFLLSFTVHPVATSFSIKGSSSSHDFILSDFILEEGKDYEISLDVAIQQYSGVSFALCKLYLSSLYPTEEVIETISEGDTLHFSFTAQSDAEYYYIKVININSATRIKVHSMQINGNAYLINSLFVPYSYIHQLALVKYDRESVSHRMWYYQDAFRILKSHGFFIGQGKDTFRYYASISSFPYLEVDPHSYLFQLWLDIGIYGVFYLLFLVILGIFSMWRNRKGNRVIVWFCIFSMCMIVLPFDCIYTIVYFKVFLMLSFLLIHDIKRRKE